MMKKSFRDFGISFDIYSRTSSELHHKTSSEFFLNLYNKGAFTEKVTEQYYDTEAGQFLADRYIEGTCPKCGFENAYGDQCENCGTSLSPSELINPRSKLSGSAPVLRETKHWFLPLNDYAPWLKEWILKEHKGDWKPNVYGQCKSWLESGDGLQARAMTRDLDWGVRVPLKDTEGKVLYVWFDAPIGYITATRELLPDTWEKYWKNEETRLIHFIGKDNIVFHCIIFPCILKAHGGYVLPENVPANEFLNLEGEKISTSRNWAVWLHEYMKDFPGKEDVLRYVLISTAPETKDNDFTWKDFQARNNNELVAILGNFINRTLVLTGKHFEGKVPSNAKMTDDDKALLAYADECRQSIGRSIEKYRLREALAKMMDVARAGNKYLADTEPWKLIKKDKERTAAILFTSLELSARLADMMEPFLPHSADKLRKMLNKEKVVWRRGKEFIMMEDHVLGETSLLFDKIDDDMIDEQIKKLNEQAVSNIEATGSTSEKMVAPAKDPTTFDDFVKMDIRTGTILEAERVPKTDKLLKLKVDTGIDQRTVVSGIAEFYEPSSIIGRQVVILVNLQPRKIRGIESQGMILMAEDKEGKLCFVSPESGMGNGSVVR
jgi:methionyl-tRNA synthetase